jgi:hypothetical protein
MDNIIVKLIGALAFIVGFIIAFTAIFTVPVWLLWNWLMPTIFGLPQIGFWQALGVLILSSILFKSTSSK